MGALVSFASQDGGGAAACDDDADARLRLMRRLAAVTAARDWLDTQARVVEYWRDLLVDAGETGELVAALDDHAAFLNAVAREIAREEPERA